MVSIKENLISALYELGAIKKGDFILKSGQRSEWYIDLRKIFAQPQLLQDFSKAMIDLINPEDIELVCGVPYGGLPFATMVAYLLDKPLLLIRKQQKAYGGKQQFEGIWEEGQRCLIIEDVITTGSSVSEIVERLVANGLRVCEVVTGVDRMQGAFDRLRPWGIHFKSVFSLKEIIAHLEST